MSDPHVLVSAMTTRARKAQAVYAKFSQDRIDEVVLAVAWTLMEPETNLRLAEQAVRDTGLGCVQDKVKKNYRKTLGLLRDIKDTKTVGIINEIPEKGLVEIARPVGVVGAVVPSTNPIATFYNKTLNALKCGNAIILAPSPKGHSVARESVQLIRAALEQTGAPVDLVQLLPAPVSKAVTYELMHQVDLLVATGSRNNVRAAYESGTPAIGVGAGNVPSIVDETADLPDAARKIVTSKVFDNATSCSSENSLIIVQAVYDEMLSCLAKEGCRLLNAAEKQHLKAAMWPEGKLSTRIVAQSADHILEVAGLDPGAEPVKVLLVEDENPNPENPFADEKLSPVLTVFRARDFEHACEIASSVLNVKGRGHSVSIHSHNDERIEWLGLNMPVGRIIVNQIHCYATGGSFDNGMPFSLSMGCGSWGGNSISDNLNYRHYLNTTRIVRTIPPVEPSLEDIFGDFWRARGIEPNLADG